MSSRKILPDNFLGECVFLFGAGASKDANLPIANELFQLLIDQINGRLKEVENKTAICTKISPYWIDYLNEIYKLTNSNFEKTVATIQILSAKEYDLSSPYYAIKFAKKDWPVKNKHGDDISDVFYNLFLFITYEFLPKQLTPKTDNLGYLDNLMILAKKRHIPIFTLNYDTSIELACKSNDIKLQLGFERYHKNERFTNKFETIDQGISLYKLHGSIDWTMDCRYADDHYSQIYRETAKLTRSYTMDKPSLILGENKLRAEGHFLELVFNFRKILKNTDYLCIIGYSFQDSHINKILREWDSKDKTVLIIDPNPPMPNGRFSTIILDKNLKEKDYLPLIKKENSHDFFIGQKNRYVQCKKPTVSHVFRYKPTFTVKSGFSQFLASWSWPKNLDNNSN